jgi:hypothetical protein
MKYKWLCIVFSAFYITLAEEGRGPVETANAASLNEPLVASQQPSYGDLWLRGSQEEKQLYLAGMGSGIHLYKRALESSFYALDTLNMDSTSLAMLHRFQSSIEEWYTRLSYIQVEATESIMIQWMDALYQKENNKTLPFQQAYVAALNEWMKSRK